MDYKPKTIEKKWQKIWYSKKMFAYEGIKNSSDKYYMLEMFPYPSGRLHMGHVRNYSIGDVVARFYKRKGYDVLHPIGWDAFGLPAENAAIENNTPPARWTRENINKMRKQFKSLGLSYDWDREIATCDANYYRWEQKFFLEMLDKGLAYRKKSEVNWCPECNTVLANEQVEDGKCWRHGCSVEKKDMRQWYFKTTNYAEELLRELDNLDGWPDAVKEMQRNWIGRSEGTYVDFAVKNSDHVLRAFTTRPDTIMGVTFASIAVEHPFSEKILEETSEPEKMEAFIREVKELHASDRMASEDYEKKGLFTGKYLVHPITEENIPLYFGNFVLADYGTGMVMAVPAHDQRDFDFAKTYNIPVKKVIDSKKVPLKEPLEEAFTNDGVMVNSDMFDGLSSFEGRKAVTRFLTEKNRGEKGVQYRLRDWGISRQRYWGNPIPIIYCKSCGTVPVPEEDLPVMLPEDVSFSGAESPLVKLSDFYEVKCPRCSGPAKRETDTMDTFVQSSWYHMKYISPFTEKVPFESKEVNKAMPVNQYVGGIEHATGHLMYTRFFTKVLNDMGYVNFREPIENLLTQGMVCMETYSIDGKYFYPEEIEKKEGKTFLRKNNKEVKTGRVEKMSKSKKNVVSPMEMVEKYGADTARLFVLFASPPQKDLEWSEAGIEGSYRFIKRIWSLMVSSETLLKRKIDTPSLPEDEQALSLYRKTHETIKKVKEDIEGFAFNTAISALMELVNQCYKFSADTEEKEKTLHFALNTLISLVNPFAPHFSEELYEMTGGKGCLSDKPFPEYSEKALVKKEITVVVQVNGKLRDKLTVAPEVNREEIEKTVRSKDYSSYLKSGDIKKIIYIPGRLVNVVG